MKKRLCALVLTVLLVLTATQTPAAEPQRDKAAIINRDNMIAVTEDMVYLESSVADPGKLFDEQHLVEFDGAGGIGGELCLSKWLAGSYSYDVRKRMPFMAYVDLGQEHEIEATAAFNDTSLMDVTFSAGMPGSWTAFSVLCKTGQYRRWASDVHTPVRTRYVGIRFGNDAGSGNIGELLLFGRPTGNPGEAFVHPEKIPISTEDVLNLDGHVDESVLKGRELTTPANWFDEQQQMSDPPTEIPETKFSMQYANNLPKSDVLLDLHRVYQLDKICLYDGTGAGEFTIYTGEPGNWEELIMYPLRYEGWMYFSVKDWKDTLNTRYLRFTKTTRLDYVHEIVLYGTPVGDWEPDTPPKPAERPEKPLMGDLMGLNSFAFYEAPEYVGSGGTIREYNTLSETVLMPYTKGTFNFNSYNLDTYYRRHFEAGITVVPCLQGGLVYLNGDKQLKPTILGADPQDPLSYKEHAEVFFQYAARYGSKTVDEDLLKLYPYNNTAASGLGYIEYYENWNEADGTWLQAEKDGFTAAQFAAMTSADYDGHEGRLGEGYGLKNADPDAKLVMGGLAGLYTDYVLAMNYWFKHNRTDGEFAADVLNFHYYAGRVSPEEAGFFARAKNVIDTVHEKIPGKEVWLTEFGWDTYINPAGGRSMVCAPDLKSQADWLLRSYLIGAAAGFDKMHMYMINDLKNPSITQYASSGIIQRDTLSSDSGRKPSWYFIQTAREALKNAVFEEILPTGTEDVWAYRFTDTQTGADIYALWCPTSDGTTVPAYRLQTKGGASAAAVYPEDQKAAGRTELLQLDPEGRTAVQNETGEELDYILDVTRKNDPPYEIIRPAGSGQATGSRYMPLDACFDSELSLDDYDNPVCETYGRDFGAFADGAGYIDFGEDFRNVRITSVWTLYRAYASYDPVPLTNMWWDDDTDCVNDSGDTETRLIFASARNLKLGNQTKWLMDGQYDSDPIVPRNRYLMVGINKDDARFVAELAFVGYRVTP